MQSGVDPRCEGLPGATSASWERAESESSKQTADTRSLSEPRVESRMSRRGASLERRATDNARDATQCLTDTSVEGRDPDQETSREATQETGLSEARPCDA